LESSNSEQEENDSEIKFTSGSSQSGRLIVGQREATTVQYVAVL